MPPKKRYVRMDRDDLAWERSDEEAESWERSLHKADIYHSIAKLIKKHKPGEAVELHRPIRGGYNIFYRLEYKDGSSAAMRIPCQEEKVKYEVATMRLVAAKTTIPVPRIYFHGTAAENPTGLGPFIILDYVEHERTMSDVLKNSTADPEESHVLDPNITEEKLEFMYGQMAHIVLQLSTLEFPRIGSLVEDESGDVQVSGGPLIQNMNSLLEFTAAHSSVLPSNSYSASTEWYTALADMHMVQLAAQRNDATLDEEDARDKYVARQLFRRLASEGRLSSDPGGNETGGTELTFRLYSEDLRPSNVLIDKDCRIVGVIDWEFAYVAPAQFSYDPPWWLLLKSPEYWPGGYAPWMEAYKPRLDTFLRALEGEEKKLALKLELQSGGKRLVSPTTRNVPLSQRMRESWESGTWMVGYAARNSWAFDFLFWRFLDAKFFGPNDTQDHHARLDLLSPQQREVMETFVMRKTKEQRERALVHWDRDISAANLARVLI